MKPSQLKCRPQVAAVIGEALADFELQRVIDCPECHVINMEIEPINNAFCWEESPQSDDFWDFIDNGQNPYDHGHEKPEVKEWAYIRDSKSDYKDEWFYKKGDKWVASDDTYYNVGFDDVEILATHKSVTMPDWVPAEITPTNSGKDKAMTNEEVKAFVADLTDASQNDHTPNYKIYEKESNLFFGAKPENDNEKNERLKLASNRVCKAKKPTAASILESGLGHMKDRAVTYDNPQGERSMGKAVDMFNILYGLELTEEQGWAFMAILKLVRTSQGEFKLDNFEGLASYAGLMGEAAAKG